MKITAFKLARKATFCKVDQISYDILNELSDETIT